MRICVPSVRSHDSKGYCAGQISVLSHVFWDNGRARSPYAVVVVGGMPAIALSVVAVMLQWVRVVRRD